MTLDRERATYEAHKDRLLEHEGRWVVISGDTIAGIRDTYTEALAAGYELFGLEPFMVKQVRAVEPVLRLGW